MARDPTTAVVCLVFGLGLGAIALALWAFIVVASVDPAQAADWARWAGANSPLEVPLSPEELGVLLLQAEALIVIGVAALFLSMLAVGFLRVAGAGAKPEAAVTPTPVATHPKPKMVEIYDEFNEKPKPKPATFAHEHAPATLGPGFEQVEKALGRFGVKLSPQQRAAFAKMTPQQRASAAKIAEMAPKIKKIVIAVVVVFVVLQLLGFIAALLAG